MSSHARELHQDAITRCMYHVYLGYISFPGISMSASSHFYWASQCPLSRTFFYVTHCYCLHIKYWAIDLQSSTGITDTNISVVPLAGTSAHQGFHSDPTPLGQRVPQTCKVVGRSIYTLILKLTALQQKKKNWHGNRGQHQHITSVIQSPQTAS